MRFARYVALGDSSTEGLEDPDGLGGYRGWADRLAESVARAQGSLLYANLAVRGRRTRRILEEQLAPALAMRPDLATVFAGTNDVIAGGFDARAVARDLEHMQRRLADGGATVLSFTLPELAEVVPIARLVARRIEAVNDALREASARTGTILVDFTEHPVASDLRFWNEDRLHANPAGHDRIARALAHALGLPGADASWAVALPPAPREGLPARLAAEWRWTARYLAPWLVRHALGRSSGDGCGPKRPELTEVRSPEA